MTDESRDTVQELTQDSFLFPDVPPANDNVSSPVNVIVNHEALTPGAFSHQGPAYGAPPSWAHTRQGGGRRTSTTLQQRRQSRRRSSVMNSSLGNSFSRFMGLFTGQSSVDEHTMDNTHTSSGAPALNDTEAPITAEIVDETAMERKIRERILEEARESSAQAAVVDMDEIVKPAWKQKWFWGLVMFALICVGAVIGLVIGMVSRSEVSGDDLADISSDTNGTPSGAPSALTGPPPTLQAISDRGYVRCGTEGIRSVDASTRGIVAFEMNVCRALSAAIFGNSSKIEIQDVDMPDRWASLKNRSVDVIASRSTHTFGRDVLEVSSETGFAFSIPYLYDGLAFAGQIESVACADRLDSFFGECRFLQVCVSDGSTHLPFLAGRLSLDNLVIKPSALDMFKGYSNGECNVVAGEANALSRSNLESLGYQGEYVIGQTTFTKEPLALVSLDFDYEWSLFIDMIINGLIEAERRGIGKLTSDQLPLIPYFGLQYESMLRDSVAAVGNYGELYSDKVAPELPRTELNLWIDRGNFACLNYTGGLLYSFPLGLTAPDFDDVSAISPGPTIDRILGKGSVTCGIVRSLDGFALESAAAGWIGFEIDLCRGIASSIFGPTNDTNFEIALFEADSTLDEQAVSLLKGSVDVILGNSVQTYRPKILDVAVSTPYFYNPDQDEALALGSSSSDTRWSDYLNWIVMALIASEETPLNMPEVTLFGEGLRGMLRNLVTSVGGYGDVYQRHLEAIWPRAASCNRLNLLPNGPQHNPLLIPE